VVESFIVGLERYFGRSAGFVTSDIGLV